LNVKVESSNTVKTSEDVGLELSGGLYA